MSIPTYDEAAKHFAIDTAKHEMTILHDDGLYRHVRFMRPGNSSYWYDLITVPYALIFRGDYESHVFSRMEDMFDFFRSNPDRATMRINPGYWAQKLTSDQKCVKSYSREKFDQYVSDILSEVEEGWPGVTAAWAEHAGEDNIDYGLDHEDSARQALNDFAFTPQGGKTAFRFTDTWECDFNDFDHGFLWSLYAIVAGIARYDAAKAQAACPVEAFAVSAGAVAQ